MQLKPHLNKLKKFFLTKKVKSSKSFGRKMLEAAAKPTGSTTDIYTIVFDKLLLKVELKEIGKMQKTFYEKQDALLK